MNDETSPNDKAPASEETVPEETVPEETVPEETVPVGTKVHTDPLEDHLLNPHKTADAPSDPNPSTDVNAVTLAAIGSMPEHAANPEHAAGEEAPPSISADDAAALADSSANPDPSALTDPSEDVDDEDEVVALGNEPSEEYELAHPTKVSDAPEQILGDPVVDVTKAANIESNRMARLNERVNMNKQSGTITYGKGVPHVRK